MCMIYILYSLNKAIFFNLNVYNYTFIIEFLLQAALCDYSLIVGAHFHLFCKKTSYVSMIYTSLFLIMKKFTICHYILSVITSLKNCRLQVKEFFVIDKQIQKLFEGKIELIVHQSGLYLLLYNPLSKNISLYK